MFSMEDEGFTDTKLHEAVRYSDIDDVRSALKEGYNPDQIGIYQWTPLHEATYNNDIDIVRLLLKYGGKIIKVLAFFELLDLSVSPANNKLFLTSCENVQSRRNVPSHSYKTFIKIY